MIIYQALSTYQILECIEHRYLFHRDEKCALILGDYIKERFSHYRDLQQFFDEIYLFRFGGYNGNAQQILEQVEAEYNKTIPYPLDEVEQFHMAGIHTVLQMLMLERNISFEMFEDGSGALSRPWVLADITKKSAPVKYELINSYGLYTHESELITKKYCDFNAQLEGFSDERAVDFNILSAFTELPEDMQNKILKFFGVEEKIDIGENKTLVLTQQFSGLGQLNFEEHVQIYQGLFDFYLDGDDVVFKLHPDDIMYYERLFPEAAIVRTKFPSELIPFAFENIPNKLVTISSTGTNLISPRFEKNLKFNELYESSFKYNTSYYMVCQLLKNMGVENAGVIDANILQLNNMVDCNDDISVGFSEEICKTMICDDLHDDRKKVQEVIEKYNSDDTVETIFFLNNKGTYNFYTCGNEEMWEKLIPVVIKKEAVRGQDNYEDIQDHVVFVLSKNENVRKACESFTMIKELHYTGVTLMVEQERKDQNTIKMLEGRLAATEKRLLEYIENEKKLLGRLKEYEGENAN